MEKDVVCCNRNSCVSDIHTGDGFADETGCKEAKDGKHVRMRIRKNW